MKEKKFMRWFALWSLAILVCFLIACAAIRFLMPNRLRETSFNLMNAEHFCPEGFLTVNDLVLIMEPDDWLTVTKAECVKNTVYLTMEATGKGSGDVWLDVLMMKSGELIESCTIQVSENGWLLDKGTGNFCNFIAYQICVIAMVLAYACLLWVGYAKSQKMLGFSYQSVFCIGLAIWVTVVGILLLAGGKSNLIMANLYGTLSNGAFYFLLTSFPFIVLFAVSLIISNVSLIRHEGFSFTNILGTLLAAAMIGGFFGTFFLNEAVSSGSTLEITLWTSFCSIFFTAYAILECFLLGAVICGIRAARKKPAYDKDYIVILGCMIRKDGTLYPLIRGRVDRAIRFYREQLEANGKQARFVVSGGKGSNEPISEAEAMKRYLLKQGIDENLILVEDQSVNTRQNMEFSKKLIGENTKNVFSTTNFHVFRSGIISRQVGFETDGMGSPTKWYFWPNAFVRELIGMISYKWKGLLLLFVPTVLFLISMTMLHYS